LKARVFQNEELEVASIPATIKELGWTAEDCVILARSTKLLEKAAQALENGGVVPYLAQRKNEFEGASIRWLHAVLRLANARHDREFLRRACVAWQSFTEIVIETDLVEAAATLNGGDFLRAWVSAALTKEHDAQRREVLARVSTDLVERLVFIDLLEWFWKREWLDDPLEKEETSTWMELHGSILREHSPDNVTLNLYLQELDLKSKAPMKTPGSLSCLTVHGAKGLEFKHVFLIGMADEVFPSYQALKKGDKSREMEEERRNCFVAITRVQETLHISWAQTYNGYNKKPSRFLREMGFSNI
jgi:DNA helicase-2/ATP-dependent DNA helicase PcrA